MKALVIGLGSMGRRRVRCLQALGFSPADIAGADPREDRRQEGARLHGIAVFETPEAALAAASFETMFICVPPDVHHLYMKQALALRLPAFVEASVLDTDLAWLARESRAAGVLLAPSSTLTFHPAVRRIREEVASGRLGRISSVLHHCGQYLPDWHAYEHVRDYYVSNPATGGGREIVPFELTWLVEVFGFPRRVAGCFRKTIDIDGAPDIDDTYTAILDHGGFLVNLTVDVVSRCATRRLLVNGDAAQLRWDWDDQAVLRFDGAAQRWERLEYAMGSAQQGYHANIGESMYIDEVACFLAAARGEAPFVNTLERDLRVLGLLQAIERSDKTSSFIDIPADSAA